MRLASNRGDQLPRQKLEIKRVQTDDEGYLLESVACIKCGYDLQGIYRDAVCPECGAPVGRSTHGDFLRFCDPKWVKRLAKGANLIMSSVVLFYCFGLVIIAFSSFGLLGDWSNSKEELFLGIVVVLSWLVLTRGLWVITSPDPAKPKGGALARGLARSFLTAALLLKVTQVILAETSSALPVQILDVVGAVALLIGLFTFLDYMRRLALRGPDFSLANQTNMVMVGVATLVGTQLVMGFLVGPDRSIWRISGLFSCGFIVGMIVFGIWSLLIALMYHRLFNTAAKTARRTWARKVSRIAPVTES